MLSLRSILREADRQWRQLYRCAPDPSQAQDDAVIGAGFFKLSHHTWNLLLDANQNWVDDL